MKSPLFRAYLDEGLFESLPFSLKIGSCSLQYFANVSLFPKTPERPSLCFAFLKEDTLPALFAVSSLYFPLLLLELDSKDLTHEFLSITSVKLLSNDKGTVKT